MNCFYLLEINSLLISSFANIFSHSVGSVFILFMIYFAVQKLLSLIRPHLFIIFFIFITLGAGSKKILLRFMFKSVLPIFSSKSFIVSGLTFRSLIHFIFVYGIRECSNFFHSFTCYCLVSPTPLTEETVFSTVYSCFLCHRLTDHGYVGLFLGILSCSIDL